jgi:hypothetical protein
MGANSAIAARLASASPRCVRPARWSAGGLVRRPIDHPRDVSPGHPVERAKKCLRLVEARAIRIRFRHRYSAGNDLPEAIEREDLPRKHHVPHFIGLHVQRVVLAEH